MFNDICKISLIVPLLFVSLDVVAGCADGNAQQMNISFPNIVTQRDAPIGSVLATTTSDPLRSAVYCANDYVYNGRFTRFTKSSSISDVYETNIPGIGIRIKMNGKFFPFSINTSRDTSYFGGATIDLIKYGPSTTGSLTSGRFARTSYGNGNGIADFNIVSGTVQSATCSVSNPSITVPMGNEVKTIFKGISTTGPTKLFNINLICDRGTNLRFRVDGNKVSTNNSVLSLNSSSGITASGIGIQILYNSNPLEIGSELALTKNSEGGVYRIPLAARYYQTGVNISSGIANAQATFTMTYK